MSDVNAQVADLLEQSRAAHARYRQAVRNHPPDTAAARQAIIDAQSLRQQAQDLDPDHTVITWLDEARSTNFVHADVMQFYADLRARDNG